MVNKDKKEIVYVLQNEAMPGLIKIGITKQEGVDKRLQTLYTTGVPLPFECLWAGEVDDCMEVEKILHNTFRDKRINPKREFFKLDPDQVIPLLEKLSSANVTPNRIEKLLNGEVTESEQNAVKQFHRPMLNFEEMGLKNGSVLVYVKDESITVTVSSSKKVKYKAEKMSLTAVTRTLLKLPYNVAPCRYWNYQGKNLQDIYDETYVTER